MANNKPLRKYHTIGVIIARLLVGVTGWKAWFFAFILNWVGRYLAKEGVYLIDVGSTYVATNMSEKQWIEVNGDSYAQVEKGGLTDEEGKQIDSKFIRAFDKFAVFHRVRKLRD